MDENPYQPPVEANADASAARRRPLRRVIGEMLVRSFVGWSGAFCVILVAHFAIEAGCHSAITTAKVINEIEVPTVFVAALVLGWAAYATVTVVRTVAWATAGSGIGVVAALLTGIAYRYHYAPAILFGLAFSIVGYRVGRRSQPRTT